MTTLASLIDLLREKHVRVWEDQGDLRVSAPRDVLTPALTAALKSHKQELLAFLRAAQPTAAVMPPIAAGPRDTPRSLSFAQERLWFLEVVGGAGAAYHVAAAVRITGALQLDVLSRAFAAIQRRHDVLRARFVDLDGQPAQVARPDVVEIEAIEWRDRTIEEAVAAAETHARIPFDIAHDALLRARLFVLNDREHVLTVTLHHLIGDGISVSIFVQELTALYQAIASGAASPLAPLPYQYADFAAAQREWLRGDALGRQVRYWRDRLADAPDAIDIASDHPRPAVVSFRGASVPLRVSGAAVDAVHRYARESDATPFMILLAAYAVLLGRSAAQDDVVIGIPIANRHADGADRLMGLFVNALPIRVHCATTATFSSIVARVKDAVLAALAHGDVPWEYLLEALQPRRDLRRPPVFQVAFALQPDPAAALRIPGLVFEPLAISTGAAKLELSLELQQLADGGFDGLLEYNTDLFESATAGRFVDRYLRLVDDLIQRSDVPTGAIDLVAADERAALARAWRGPDVAFDLEDNIPRAFSECVRRHPERAAVVLGDRVMTFADLDRQSAAIARRLIEAGVLPGQPVGVIADRTPETIAGLWGVLRAGGAYVPLDPAWPGRRLQRVIDLAGCRAIVLHASRSGRMPAVAARLVTIEDSANCQDEDATRALPEPRRDDAAYILFTSGSTGEPKGVVVEQHSVLHLLAALEHAVYGPLGVRNDARVSVNGALTFDTSVKQIFQVLQGRTLVLIPDELRLDGAALLAYAAETAIDVLECTPSQLTLLADAGLGAGRGGVKAVLSGGEALTAALWRRLSGPDAPRIVNLYGPTECTVDATVHILERDEPAPILGTPLPNIQVLVLDGEMRPVPICMPGEICIGGAGLARGYLGDPDTTRARFVPNPFADIASARLYRTGDRGRVRSDGRLEYLGRLDHQIKLRGHRIELSEIERAIELHPDVQAACALVVGDADVAPRLVACAAVDPLRCAVVNGRKRYRLPNGLAIAQLNPNETDFLYKEMFERNAYLRHGLTIHDGDVLVDVGSNIGMFALSMQAQHAGLRIVCVEPNPHVRGILADNLRLFGADAIVHDCGVSVAEGRADFTFYPGFSILSGLHANADDDKAVVRSYIRRQTEGAAASATGVEEILDAKFQSVTVPVRLRPLGDLIDESALTRIDLLKINVEKAELDALLGIRATQWPMIRQVALEVHDVEGRLDTVRRLLETNGFSVTVEEDWSLEHAAGTNYYVYALRPETTTPAPDTESSDERLRHFAAPFITTPDVRAFLEERLPEYMLPSTIAITDRLPLNAHGKVDRRALAQWSWNPDGESTDDPLTPEETALAAHWCAVLQLDDVGPRDHFFRVGGHSLSAVRLATRVREAFHVHFSVTSIFEFPVLRDMAAHLHASVASEPLPPIVPHSLDGPLPLSFAQERLLFLEQLEGGGRAYVIAGAAELNGVLDVPALRRALHDICARHPVLRSAFSLDSGSAEARILDRFPDLDIEDWTGLPDAVDWSAALDWMRQRAEQPFEVTNGLPIRAALLRLTPTRHLLFVGFHHLVADGWSVNVFLRELSEWYRVHTGGNDEAPPPLEIGYYDYARWQRSWRTGPRLSHGLAYWTKQLAHAAPFLDLPTDRPRPEFNAYRGATVRFDLSPAERARIESCAQALDATPFMLLLGVFAAVLHRWSGQSGVVIGSPSAGRAHPGTENLIGLFVNMLVLRLDVGSAPTFRGLMQDVRRTTLDAIAHEDVPFEQIVEALRPPRLLNRHPLFQVLFAFQNLPHDTPTFRDMTWDPVSFDSPTGRFDLELVIDDANDDYRATLEYSADLFEAATVERVATHFRALLAEVLAKPDAEIATIDFTDTVSLAEVRALNPPETPAPQFRALPQLVRDQARLHPSAIALSYRDIVISYDDLGARVRSFAASLRQRGVRTGDIVAIYTNRSPAWVAGALAVLECHAVFLPIDPDYPIDRVRWMVADAGAAWVITQRSLWTAFGEADAEPLFLDDAARIDDERTHPASEDDIDLKIASPESDFTPDSPAYLIYTSGSTGVPKGALNTHGGLANLTRNFLELFGTGPASRVLHFASIGFDASVADLVMALAAGSCLCLADREALLPGSPLADTLVRDRITHATLPPSVLGSMTDTAFPDLAVLMSAGEALTPELVRRWSPGRRFFNNYGPTEAAVCATVAECHADDDRVTIGRPLQHVQVHVLDPALRAVPIGMVGEIGIGGAGLAAGYWRRPELTAERFVTADPHHSGTPFRLYRTGDQGRFLANGMIEFLGRRDQQIKLNGFRIELGEVESALRAHPDVRDCAVVVQAPDGEYRRLVAFIVGESTRKDAQSGDVRPLKEFLRARLPDYMVPSLFVDLEHLPLTPNAKLDRRALEQWSVTTRETGPATSTLESDTAKVVASIFAEVLGRPAFGTRDDFFEHGGHSLLAAQVMARLRDRLRTTLTLRALFEAPTPRALAARVDAVVASALPVLAASTKFEDRAVLSSSQRRLWLLDQLDGSHGAYHIVAAARLHGALDIQAFGSALRELCLRHEVLRTCYPSAHGEPMVRLLDETPALRIADIAGSSADDRRERARQFAAADSKAPFDLAHGPLFRPVLYRISPTEHLFVATMHHIVADGWSVGVLVSEVAALYQAAHSGRPAPPAPAVQYGDYARWQERVLQRSVHGEQLAYWRTRLAASPTRLELPCDSLRPTVQTFRGRNIRFRIDAAIAAALRTHARSCDATLFMSLLAAFAAFLSRYSGQDDLIIGTPVANRRVREIEPLIGFFANTLAMRTRVIGDEPFSNLLRRVRHDALDAFSHADVPFEAVVAAVQPERDLSHSPLFQVMFAMTSGLVGQVSLAELTIEPVTFDGDAAKFDLTLFVDDGNAEDGDLAAIFEYNADLFHAATMTRMAENFTAFLADVTRTADAPVGDLALAGASERSSLRSWNDTASESSDETVCDLFQTQAARTPASPAVTWAGGHLSYAELDRQSNQLAHHLRGLGVRRDSLVAIYLDRSPELIVALLGVLKAGSAYVPLDIQYPEARVAFMLTDSDAAIVLTTTALESRLPKTRARVVALDRESSAIAAAPTTTVARLDRPDSLAYMIYTSGSTGTPKGVLIEHRGLANYLRWATRAYRMHEGTGAPFIGSIGFDATITSIFGPLVSGQHVVLLPEGRELETLASPAFANADHSFYKITPAHLDGLNALVPGDRLAGRVRALVIGGEALTGASLAPWHAHAPAVAIINEYGPTETVVGCTAFRVVAGETPAGTIPIGRPIANTRIYLLDERQRPVPIGAVGEIYIAGDGVARGYHARPELTAERFLALPLEDTTTARPAATRCYRSGDLARWTHDGQLLFLGRRDGQVKLRGHRIELGEIEHVAKSVPGVAHAAAVLQHRVDGDARLALYLVAQPSERLNLTVVRAHLQQALPPVMVPGAIHEVGALPLTSNGKVDRDALATIEAPTAATPAPSAQDHVRDLLATIWTALLGTPVSAESDFFASGGHSLAAAKLTARIRDVFGVDLPLRAIFEHPTLESQAQLIAENRRTAQALPPIEPTTGAPPLSFGQQRLWTIEQLDVPGSAYHIPAAFRLQGDVNPAALERSLHDIVRRHDVLRSSIPTRDGRPYVQISAELPRLSTTDLRQHSAETREEMLHARLRALALEPFDLALGPLLRASLFRLGDRDWAFAIVLHHLVSDGWSSAILAHELREGYLRHRDGGGSEPEALPFQYSDYAAWQRRSLDGEPLERLRNYWTDSLRGAPPGIALPATGTRPLTQSYRGAVIEFQLDADLRERLVTLARREGATLYMVLLTAYAAMLSRWCGQDDIVIGTPVANRSQAGADQLIGFFVNTLPIRVKLPRDATFRTTLTSVRDTALQAFDHQELPFERLVELLNPPRRPASAPIFQVLFAYQHADAADLTLPGVTVTPIRVPHASAKFDLTLAIDDRTSGLDGFLEYSADLFADETMREVAERFVAFLDVMSTDAGRAIRDVPMLTGGERRQLAVWNDTRQDYAESRLVHEIIEDQARITPNAVALEFDGETLTYGDLNAKADILARELSHAGVGSDVLVGVCLERSFDLLIAVLGILKAGGAYVPLDPEYPSARLAGMVEDARLHSLITRRALLDRKLFDAAALPASLITLEPAFWDRPDRHRGVSLQRAGADHLAYVIFTSGSTGRPKGVMIEHRAIRNRLLWMQDRYQLTPSDAVLQKTPFSFDVSVWELFWPLMIGARLVIARPGGHRDAAYLARVIDETNVTTLHFVPSMLQVFLEEPNVAQLHSLRRVFCSGEALPWEVVRRFRGRITCPLHNLYGPTEAAVDVTSWECQIDDTQPTVPIGRPIANTRIHILDDDGRQAPIGMPGELHIGGLNLARGYVNQPALTAERFVPNPFAAGDPDESDRLYRTGDLARWRPDGEIEFLGRRDAQVKLHGFRIELGEIETALMQVTDVAEAAAALVADVDSRSRLVGYIVPRDGRMPDAATLRRSLQTKLPEYMIPALFVQLDALPVGPTGKLDRGALPLPASPVSAATGEPPQTAIERLLASVWEEVLGITAVSRDGNFFELGGDSILAIQMAARARRSGLNVSPHVLLEHQTVAALAEAIQSTRAMTAEQGLLDGPVSSAPIVHWFAEQRLPTPAHFNQSVLLSTKADLDAETLRHALHLIVKHHDALRVRWDDGHATPELRYGPMEGAFTFDVIDMSRLPPEERRQTVESSAAALQSSLNLLDGPSSKAAYLHGGAGESGRFLWVAHHLAVDGVSWTILLDDLERIYRLLAAGREAVLPPKTSSWRQWTEAWQSAARSGSLAAQKSFWKSHALTNQMRLPTAATHAAARVTDQLDAQASRWLAIDWPRAHRATGQDVILAALWSAWSDVFHTPALSVDVEGHGRIAPSADIDVSRTVGWFTAVYPLALASTDAHLSPAHRLNAVREETSQVPDGGASFGALKYLARDGDLIALPRPPVLFNYLGRLDDAASESAMFGVAHEDAGPSTDPRNASPYAIEFVAALSADCLRFHWHSPAGQIGEEQLHRLAGATMRTLRDWAQHSSSADPATQTKRDDDETSPLEMFRARGYAPLVRLHNDPASSPSAPLFLVHPGGGTVLPYRDLAARLDTDCYGLQAPGLGDDEHPVASVEALATHYADAIVAQYPSGPYRIGGWSFGGIVAFDMAHRLRAMRRDVELLAILDVHAPGALPAEEWQKDNARLLVDIFAEDLGVGHDDLAGRPLDEQLADITRRAIAAKLFPANFTIDAAQRIWAMFQAHRRAERQYQGTPYAGDVLLITSDVRLHEQDPTLGWSRFARRVAVQRVPGNHQQILRVPSVDRLAAALRAYVPV